MSVQIVSAIAKDWGGKMYVIVTLAPGLNGPIHVYGGPWTLDEAQREKRKIAKSDREMYPDELPVQILIRRISTDPEHINP
jgi:hypothetical protein